MIGRKGLKQNRLFLCALTLTARLFLNEMMFVLRVARKAQALE